MRILILNADYPGFLRSLYSDTPGLAQASYRSQMEARNASLFGVADFYSVNFRAQGHEAAEIHINNDCMQSAWARENGLSTAPSLATVKRERPRWVSRLISIARPALRPVYRRLAGGHITAAQKEVLAAQIEQFRPDVVLNQELAWTPCEFFRSALPPGCRLVGQIASELPQHQDFSCYDLVISSLPSFVSWFRSRGIRAELSRLAFEPCILDAMGPQPERDIPLSFVGSLMAVHRERIALLEYIAERFPLQVWGNAIELLPKSSPLHAAHRGVVWGRRMYDVLRRSQITINQHGFIPLVKNEANNMRLYEATGMGALLMSDLKPNLGEIFTVGSEMVAYSSPQECAAQISHYLAQEEERKAIAAAGQRRTVSEHNYFNRMEEITRFVNSL